MLSMRDSDKDSPVLQKAPIFLHISALVPKKWSNQKNKSTLLGYLTY